MQETDDIELLRRYAEHNSEAAFATLVERHINLVYSVALRHVGNPHHAEEIVQAVFVILARKSGQLRRGVVVSGWLYHAARLTAANFIRSETQRARREQEAYMRSSPSETEPEVWLRLAPLLDKAMAGLGEKDRDAVVLRFFEGKKMHEVGSALGINEEAAKKRTIRAVEKLRKFFTKRGVIVPTAVFAAAVSANSVQAAPAVLTKTVTGLAVAKGAAASASTLTLIKGALKLMAWQKTKTVMVVGVIALLAAGTATISARLLRAGDATGISFEAEGTMVYETYHTHNLYSHTKHFIITRQGALWKIRTTNMVEERDGVETQGGDQIEAYSEMGYDGTNIYNLRLVDEQKALALLPPPAGYAKKYLLATGRVTKGDAPPYLDTELQYPIWLAYCSGPYFKNLKGDQAVPPTFAERDFLNERPVPIAEKAKWSQDENLFVKDVSWYCDGTFKGFLGGGKTMIAKYQPPYDKPFMDRHFEILSWTNWNGISVPSSFRIAVYYPDYSTNGPAQLATAYTFKGTLEQIRMVGNFSPVPELTTRTGISDFRGPRGPRDFNSTISTNHWDFSDAIHPGAAGRNPQ